ncbi:MAG: pirin-like C-terminal cupin domain-containing protein [Salibacteraceae bacterium]
MNGQKVGARDLVVFHQENGIIRFRAQQTSRLLFGYGSPFNEPIVAQGSFVMNTQAEIQQAFNDYQQGKLGIWED